jgi:hypothetical protein
MHQLTDDKLRGLIIEETGSGDDSTVPAMILASIKAIRKYADFSSATSDDVDDGNQVPHVNIPALPENGNMAGAPHNVGMNLSYTINLNLPATSDIAVFNAIFKSLRENLLRSSDA